MSKDNFGGFGDEEPQDQIDQDDEEVVDDAFPTSVNDQITD
jgi:hypothetical protein